MRSRSLGALAAVLTPLRGRKTSQPRLLPMRRRRRWRRLPERRSRRPSRRASRRSTPPRKRRSRRSRRLARRSRRPWRRPRNNRGLRWTRRNRLRPRHWTRPSRPQGGARQGQGSCRGRSRRGKGETGAAEEPPDQKPASPPPRPESHRAQPQGLSRVLGERDPPTSRSRSSAATKPSAARGVRRQPPTPMRVCRPPAAADRGRTAGAFAPGQGTERRRLYKGTGCPCCSPRVQPRRRQ